MSWTDWQTDHGMLGTTTPGMLASVKKEETCMIGRSKQGSCSFLLFGLALNCTGKKKVFDHLGGGKLWRLKEISIERNQEFIESVVHTTPGIITTLSVEFALHHWCKL